MMLLAVDVGNTNITFGVFEEERCILVSRLSTDKLKMPDQYICEFINIFNINKIDSEKFTGSIISCVVPELKDTLINAVTKATGCAPLVIGPGIKTGLNILTDNPAQVGADIIVGSVAASEKYEMPCLVIDLGTASKISALDEKGNFCGMTICCGVKLSLDALATQASLLPNVSITPPKKVIGKNTVDCMQSGVVYGTASMIDGLVDRFCQEMNSPVKTLVATGGYAKNIVENCKKEIIYDENLLLDGLRIIYNKNRK